MCFGGAQALLPVYAKDILHGGPEQLGLLRAAPGIGALAMSLLMPWAFGLTACPLGNTVLAMHARYQVSTRELLNRNRVFSFQMLVVSIIVLQIYERVTAV